MIYILNGISLAIDFNGLIKFMFSPFNLGKRQNA